MAATIAKEKGLLAVMNAPQKNINNQERAQIDNSLTTHTKNNHPSQIRDKETKSEKKMTNLLFVYMQLPSQQS